MPDTYPKIYNDNDWSFDVSFDDGSANSIKRTNIRALHAVLTEKIAEQDAKKWEVRPSRAIRHGFVVYQAKNLNSVTPFHLGTPEQNKADAEEYAARLNAREGLS